MAEAAAPTVNAMQTVASGIGNVFTPSIDGDFVTFGSDAAGNADVYLYRHTDGQLYQVTSDTNDQYLSNIRGDKIAFVELSGGSGDIYVATFSVVP